MTAHWTELGLRQTSPRSARTQNANHPLLGPLIAERLPLLDEPVTGITTDGLARPGLFNLDTPGAPTAAITEAAMAVVEALTEAQQKLALFTVDAEEWRLWLNVHPNITRHGVLLEELSGATRSLVLDLLKSVLSARGHRQALDIMRLNELLVALTGKADDYGHWPYFLSFFGRPSFDDPWGFQLDGHHLNINAVVVGDQLVATPTFMGSEPCHVHEGPLAGTTVFEQEERAGLDLIRSLSDQQRSRAITHPSILTDALPPELQHPFDGRMVGGALHDNAVVPYEGLVATDLSDAQRHLLRNLIATYVGWIDDAHAGVKMNEVDHHLDETRFSWMGTTGDNGPFYYRVHSPVVLIELDHHPGVVFNNDQPSRNHIHTVIRTPNGGDYGTDLLRQHHERYDHTNGTHEHRR